MNVDVVLLPGMLQSSHLQRTVVVFDVLRATTTMAAALNAGVSEIRVFPTLESAKSAAAEHGGMKLLCGESRCLPPPGFDLGNSPGAFGAAHAGMTAFMATTNGTRAIVAAQSAPRMLAAALVNARATAQALFAADQDVTLLCAGTNEQVAMEDIIGAGAVIAELEGITDVQLDGDSARLALRAFESCRTDLRSALAGAQGGRNVLEAGLGEDIAFAARLNSIRVVATILRNPLRVVWQL